MVTFIHSLILLGRPLGHGIVLYPFPNEFYMLINSPYKRTKFYMLNETFNLSTFYRSFTNIDFIR